MILRWTVRYVFVLALAGCGGAAATPGSPVGQVPALSTAASFARFSEPSAPLVPEPPFAPRNPYTERHDRLADDPSSRGWINAMFARSRGGFNNLLELAVSAKTSRKGGDHGASPAFAIYSVNDATDPVYQIHCASPTCPLEGKSIHLTPGAVPEMGCAGGGECHIEFLDLRAQMVYGLYQLKSPYIVPFRGGKLTVGYGGFCPLDAYAKGVCQMADTAGSIAVMSALVRPEEVLTAIARRGDLGHALYISACARNGEARWPAASGTGIDPACPPQGVFIVLRNWSDARIAAAKIPEVARVFMRTLAHYGYVLSDNGASPLSLGFEDGIDRPVGLDPWPAVMAAICAEGFNLDCSVSLNSYHTQLPVIFKESDLAITVNPQ